MKWIIFLQQHEPRSFIYILYTKAILQLFMEYMLIQVSVLVVTIVTYNNKYIHISLWSALQP